MESLERYIRQLVKVASHGLGAKTQKHSPRYTGGQVATAAQHSQINTYPEERLPHIQDMDPGSANFGGFIYMAGYDPLGGDAPLGG